MSKICSQEEFTSLVKKVYETGSHEKEPVRKYQRFLNKLPDNSEAYKFIKYIFSSLLGEANHECRFITVVEPPFTAWIKSHTYPVKITDEAIEILKSSGWDAGYPRGEIGEVKGKHVLIGDLEYEVVRATVDRRKQRSKS